MNDAVNGTQRSTAIGTAVAELTAGGGNRTYAAVPAALRWLSEHPVDGRPQRVILVTANTDNTPDTSRAQVIAAVQEAIAGQQIRLDIVGVGENAPDQALTDLAQAGGGSYTDVQQTPNLGGALTELVNAT
nr:vWA domain-containing protein [Nakamurella aerolata]